MDQDFYLRHYLRQCRDELDLYEKYIAQCERRLAARGGTLTDTGHTEHMLAKTEEQLHKYRTKRLSLLCEIEGEIDQDRFREFSEKNALATAAQHAQADAKKKAKLAAPAERKRRMEKENRLSNHGGRYDRTYRGVDGPSERDMLRSLQYLERTSGFVPNYIRENLSRMSGNRGYVWRQIFFFGEAGPSEGDPTSFVLFEKDRETLFIHEWTRERYTLHQKKNRNAQREPVSSIPRPSSS